MDPQSKLLVSLVPGRRTTRTIHQVVADAAERLAAKAALPALFTDGEPTYREAIVATFGRAYPVPRRGPRGRPPAPLVRIPQALVYAQIVKHRQGGRIQQVEVRPIFGKGKFRCKQCGYTAHADYNAARNIRARALVNTPIVSTYSVAAG